MYKRQGLLEAAESGEARLLLWLSSNRPQQVAASLGKSAEFAPTRLQLLFREVFTPPTAFALGERLDQALRSECDACANQAQSWIDAAFNAAGEDSRNQLRLLGDEWLTTATGNVLAHTLGLDSTVSQS